MHEQLITNMLRKYEENTNNNHKKGVNNPKTGAYSLTELVVTMAVIMVLILVIWFVLNPMEMINKTADDKKLSRCTDFAKIIASYYIGSNTFPWNVRNAAYVPTVRSADKAYIHDPTVEPEERMYWVWTLVDGQEFTESVGKSFVEDGYYIYKAAGDTYVWVCFEPKSNAFKKKAADACNSMTSTRTAPERYRTFNPCQTVDGSIPDPATGMRNLLCVAD